MGPAISTPANRSTVAGQWQPELGLAPQVALARRAQLDAAQPQPRRGRQRPQHRRAVQTAPPADEPAVLAVAIAGLDQQQRDPRAPPPTRRWACTACEHPRRAADRSSAWRHPAGATARGSVRSSAPSRAGPAAVRPRRPANANWSSANRQASKRPAEAPRYTRAGPSGWQVERPVGPPGNTGDPAPRRSGTRRRTKPPAGTAD